MCVCVRACICACACVCVNVCAYTVHSCLVCVNMYLCLCTYMHACEKCTNTHTQEVCFTLTGLVYWWRMRNNSSTSKLSGEQGHSQKSGEVGSAVLFGIARIRKGALEPLVCA